MTLMLAKKWEPKTQDPTGWLMSEKLDGIRAYWNGSNMYSRNGLMFYPPAWFKELLPKDLALDGELWTERDDFQKAVSIVKKHTPDEEAWRKITYMVYDAPQIKKKFTLRLKALEKELNDKRSEDAKKHVIFHK